MQQHEKLSNFMKVVTGTNKVVLRYIPASGTSGLSVKCTEATITDIQYDVMLTMSKDYKVFYHPNKGSLIVDGEIKFNLSDSCITGINTFYIDFDCKDLKKFKVTDPEYIEKKAELKGKIQTSIAYQKSNDGILPTTVVETRHGFHLYYNVVDFPDGKINRFSTINIAIGNTFNMEFDTTVCNPAQLLRVPLIPFPQEYSDFTTTVIFERDERNYTIAEYMDWLGFDNIDIIPEGVLPTPSIQYHAKAEDAGDYFIKFKGDSPLYPVTLSTSPGGYLTTGCPECGVSGDVDSDNLMVNLDTMIGGCWSCETGDGNSRGCKVFESAEKYAEGVEEFKDENFPDITWCDVVDGDDFLKDEPSLDTSLDLDMTEKALMLFLKSKKDVIEQNVKDMLGDQHYNYLWGMAEQIGIIKKDIIPFFIYNCIGVLTGNAVTVEWITNYTTWLNMYGLVNADPGSGKSPLQDVFLKSVKNIYEHCEQVAIDKASMKTGKTTTYGIPVTDNTFDFSVAGDNYIDDDDGDADGADGDADGDIVVKDDYVEPNERYPVIIDNTSEEAKMTVMAKFGYTFQMGSELSEYLGSRYGDPTKAVPSANKEYSGTSINVNRKSRPNEKVPNCCASILTEGQDQSVQQLYSDAFVESGFTARFDIIRMGRRRAKISGDECNVADKSAFEDLMLSIADSRMIIKSSDDDLIFDGNIPHDRYVGARCHYKGDEYVVLFAKYMGNYYNLLISRVMRRKDDDVKQHLLNKHRDEVEPILKFAGVVSHNMDYVMQKITERLAKYIGITSMIRYTFGRKNYFEYDKTDIDYAFNYLHYSLYHNLTNEYQQPRDQKDISKVVGALHKYFADNEVSRVEWSKINKTALVKTIGKTKFRGMVTNHMEKHDFFKIEKVGQKIFVVMIDDEKIKTYLERGTV